jgi:hypothetical protein
VRVEYLGRGSQKQLPQLGHTVGKPQVQSRESEYPMALILRTVREIALLRADYRLNMAPLREASREAQDLALTAPQR